MQVGCDEIEFFISKSVDGEATLEERALVDSHIAGCDHCACKLTSYMEMAAVFSEAPIRTPDAHVRSGVFAEIHRLKEAARSAEEIRASGTRPHGNPALGYQPTRIPTHKPTIGSRLWSLGSPFAVMGAAIAALLVIVTLATPPSSVEPHISVARLPGPVIPGGIVTQAVASVYQKVKFGGDGIPSPVETRAAVYLTASSVRATVPSTASFVRDRVLELSQPTAVWESGDPITPYDGHLVRDPAFGYSISYPTNWWTQVRDSTRYFYPWGPGGVRYAPYWIELQVEDNPKGYTAQTAMADRFCGSCAFATGIRGDCNCLRRSFSDEAHIYNDELYMFDSRHVYRLRAKVPLDSNLGDFQERLGEIGPIFGRMSGSMTLAPAGPVAASGYAPVLFLNGSDLWAVNAGGSGARPITRGYVVQQFALMPDLRHVVFSATNNPNDRNAETKYIYTVDIEGDSQETPQLLSSRLPVYDIALYGDRAVLAIGKVREQVSGIYRIPVTLGNSNAQASVESAPQLLTELSGDMAVRGLGGLAVSPDRQLITFLAPFGAEKGTDIYAVRPDGADLHKLVSHTEVTAPSTGGEDALTHENQAIKSYTWLDGSLYSDGYRLDMLFTCGTFSSPTLFRGGFLYSAKRAGRGTLLNPSMLDVIDAEQIQIVHLAYSPQGKVALTGFYNLHDNRVEALAGLWTADVVDGNLTNLEAQPTPVAPNGITDLQWTADGNSLIYRETVPQKESSMVSKYEGDTEFRIVRLDVTSSERTILYDTTGR